MPWNCERIIFERDRDEVNGDFWKNFRVNELQNEKHLLYCGCFSHL